MNLTDWEYGTLLLVFGMGLTLATLYILTWVMRILTFVFRDKEQS
ncbi:MAG: OadG-related small transporter subunit [Desulfotomaculales bacterium]